MKTQRPEALALANTALQVRNKDTPDDVYVALGDCAWALRNLHAENERLCTCNKDAQHEIASLQERVQQLGQLARDVNSRRVVELEAQLAAIGAGGVEPLRKRCLHQISEPAQPVAVERIGTMFFPSSPEHSILGIFLSAMSDQLKIDAPAMRDAMLWYCGVQEIATTPQPAAPAQAAPASIITASVMRDDGGEHPAFCLMVAYRTEKAAMAALAMLTGAPAQAATAKQSPHPEYDKGFSDGCNRCEERQAAAPAQAGEYPELPIRYATYDAWGNQTKHGYNAKDMHAYVDADRAARGAAQAAPEDASARFKAQHEFLIWNREQTPPPIESATEYSVFNQAVDFYIAARAAQEGK